MEKLEKPPTVPEPMIAKIASVLDKGIMPGTLEYFQALGAEASQRGITPTAHLGPFGQIRDAWSQDAQSLIKEQQTLAAVGQGMLKQLAETEMGIRQSQRMAPPRSILQQQYGAEAFPSPLQPATVELPGPGAPVPTGITPGQGFTPQELQEPFTGAQSRGDVFARTYATRSRPYFEEGPRPMVEVMQPNPDAPLQPWELQRLEDLRQNRLLAVPGEEGSHISLMQPGLVKTPVNMMPPDQIQAALAAKGVELPPDVTIPKKGLPTSVVTNLMGATPTQRTETVKLMKGGIPHQVVIDKATGKEIQDLGPTETSMENLLSEEGVPDALISKGFAPFDTVQKAIKGDKFAQMAIENARAEVQGRAVQRREAEAKAGLFDAGTAKAITLLENLQNRLNTLKSMKDEAIKYVGPIKKPMKELMQYFAADPRFAEWNTNVAYLTREFFSDELAGAALTEIERNILKKSIAHGEELSIEDFVAKLEEASKDAEFLIKKRYDFGTKSRREIQEGRSAAEKARKAAGY